MFKGLRTVLYYTTDMEATKTWYRRVLQQDPTFDSPEYVGFNVGGYELGIFTHGLPVSAPPSGAMVYWGVDSIDRVWQYLLDEGASVHSPIADVGDGIRLGTVLDPFGNVFGIIENPNFKGESA